MKRTAQLIFNVAGYLALFLASALIIRGPQLSERQADRLIDAAIWLKTSPTTLFMIMVFIGHLLIALLAFLPVKRALRHYIKGRNLTD